METADLIFRFQEALPADPDANRISPIKLTVSRIYGHSALPPILTFYFNKGWLEEKFGVVDDTPHLSFKYDEVSDPPAGIIVFRNGAAKLKNAGPYSRKVNFYAWPSIKDDGYSKRCQCPIIELGTDSVSFHMPPDLMRFNVNTQKWEKSVGPWSGPRGSRM